MFSSKFGISHTNFRQFLPFRTFLARTNARFQHQSECTCRSCCASMPAVSGVSVSTNMNLFSKGPTKEDRKRLQDAFTADELGIARCRSKLYSRVSHYTNLAEGEDYDVDLNAATFESKHEGVVYAAGPLQVLGTYHNGEFLWSWHNSSIPQHVTNVSECAKEQPELQPFLKVKKFTCEADVAEQLAQWLAYKCGFMGAFEAPYGNTMTYLLLKLATVDGASIEPADNIWCSSCGLQRHQCRVLMAASADCAICNTCVERLQMILDDTKAEGQTSTFSDIATMPPCLVCGERTERIFTDYGSLCHECVDAMSQSLASHGK